MSENILQSFNLVCPCGHHAFNVNLARRAVDGLMDKWVRLICSRCKKSFEFTQMTFIEEDRPFKLTQEGP